MQNFQKNWDYIKEYYSRKYSETPLYCDEDDQVIVYKRENATDIIGYMHIKNSIPSSEYIFLTNQYGIFVSELKVLGKKWNSVNILIITNIQLRNIGTGITNLPKDVTYLQIANDTLIEQNLTKEIRIAYLDYNNKFEQQLKRASNSNQHYWDCDICGGDSTTGCLYHDPTECPRQRHK